jgi:hypothetical protein
MKGFAKLYLDEDVSVVLGKILAGRGFDTLVRVFVIVRFGRSRFPMWTMPRCAAHHARDAARMWTPALAASASFRAENESADGLKVSQ